MPIIEFSEAEVFAFYRDLLEALRRNSEQVAGLGKLWVSLMRPSRFFICVHRPKGPGSLYEYPIFKFHLRGSKKGKVRAVRAGLVLTRKRAARFGQGEWWRDHKSFILVFNRCMGGLKRERSQLLELLAALRRLVDLGRESLVARFPASHHGELYARREIMAIEERESASILAARPKSNGQEGRL
jgi:hypothetical protein